MDLGGSTSRPFSGPRTRVSFSMAKQGEEKIPDANRKIDVAATTNLAMLASMTFAVSK
jgi:hypothetical protein